MLYRIYVSNLSSTTPPPKLLIEANIPQSVGVNRPALGKCAPKRCDSTYVARFGNVVRWELADIPAGSASVRELRVFIDNSAEFPPPAENTKRAALPSGTSVVSASEGAAMNGNTIEWDRGNLAAGNADTRELRLKRDKRLKPGSFVVLSPEIKTCDPKQRPTIRPK